MQLVNPIFLWALTGLSIPIGIHLLSRKEGQVIRLGSLRHVQETSTQQFRGIRLNEILLLILRCLLIALFTLILCGLRWNNPLKAKWVLLERGLEKQPQMAGLLDSLSDEGYELRMLSENFPLQADSVNQSEITNYNSLVEDLCEKEVSDVIVFAQNRVDKFRGLRLSLPSHVRWISQSLPAIDYTLQTVKTTEDSVTIRHGHTSAEATHFTTERISSASATDMDVPDTIQVVIVSDGKFAHDSKMIKAALRAIEKTFPIELKWKELKSGDPIPVSDWLVWLSDSPLPFDFNSNLLFLNETVNSQELFVQAKANQWTISQRLNEDVALQENLTLKLTSLLLSKEKLQMKAIANDRRMTADAVAWSEQQEGRNAAAFLPSTQTNLYLIVALMLLLFIERMIAYKRNQ